MHHMSLHSHICVVFFTCACNWITPFIYILCAISIKIIWIWIFMYCWRMAFLIVLNVLTFLPIFMTTIHTQIKFSFGVQCIFLLWFQSYALFTSADSGISVLYGHILLVEVVFSADGCCDWIIWFCFYINAYHHWCCEFHFSPIQPYVIKFVCHLQ